jgi:hypothetical protein
MKNAGKEEKEFSFDNVFSPEDSQEFFYENSVKPIVSCCLAGYNGCVFAYGQTASGKTYTMMGSGVEASKDRGVIPRVAEQIVKTIKKNEFDENGNTIEYKITGTCIF